jgi:hypothetical protein
MRPVVVEMLSMPLQRDQYAGGTPASQTHPHRVRTPPRSGPCTCRTTKVAYDNTSEGTDKPYFLTTPRGLRSRRE